MDKLPEEKNLKYEKIEKSPRGEVLLLFKLIFPVQIVMLATKRLFNPIKFISVHKGEGWDEY